MAWLRVDTSDIERIEALFERRADSMVEDSVREGESRAEDYAAAGGRHRNRPGRYTHLRRRGVVRVHHATGAQKARMVEHVLYHRFLDFWGNW